MDFEDIGINSPACQTQAKKLVSCQDCIRKKRCMERDRNYPCIRFQRREETSCIWNMQEKEDHI